MLDQAVFHHCKMATGVLRVVIVSTPEAHCLAQLVADEGVRLQLIKSMLAVTEAGGKVLREVPFVRKLYGDAATSPKLGVTGNRRRRCNEPY